MGDQIELTDLICKVETAKAYLLTNSDGVEVWIPKSQVINILFGDDVIDDKTHKKMREVTVVTIPEWLANKNNLN